MGPQVDTLRRRLRELIAQEMPADYRGPFRDDASVQATRRFCQTLAHQRLLTVDWPVEWGGGGASRWAQLALREEMWAHDEPRGAQYMGLSWVGPALMLFGTEQQKAEHLPRISRGEVTWCQGFSEPESGSDLASLSLAARPDGPDRWRLSGQKIWTSYADIAQWCFLAARTSRGEKKHHGITIFLIPTDREGITVRPIPSMLGKHHLNEVHFDNVVATRSDVLGEVDQGWSVITAVLAFERVGIPRYARSDRILSQLWEACAARPEAHATRTDLARALVRCRVARLLAYRVVGLLEEEGDVSMTEAATARIASTLLDQEVAELAMEVLGPDALDDAPDAPLRGRAEDHWRYARSATVASGTVDVQRLIIGRALVRQR